MSKRDQGQLLIGLFKLLKAASLSTASVAALVLPQHQRVAVINRALVVLHPGGRVLHRTVSRGPPHRA